MITVENIKEKQEWNPATLEEEDNSIHDSYLCALGHAKPEFGCLECIKKIRSIGQWLPCNNGHKKPVFGCTECIKRKDRIEERSTVEDIEDTEDTEEDGIKKVTTFDFGTALLQFIPVPNISLPEKLTSTQRQQMDKEIVYLNIFIVDFAVSQALGDTPARNNALDIFYSKILSSEKWILEEIKYRYDKYDEAVRTPHHDGPPWTVGKAFSELCGYEMDLDVIMTGSILFGTGYKAVFDFAKSEKII